MPVAVQILETSAKETVRAALQDEKGSFRGMQKKRRHITGSSWKPNTNANHKGSLGQTVETRNTNGGPMLPGRIS